MVNITVTDKAAARLKEIMAAKGENLALRVLVRTGGCRGLEYGMALERQPRQDDLVTRCGDLQVVVDPQSAEHLEGVSIDYVDALMGGGFTIHNPNAVSTCGCGQSFRTEKAKGSPKSCNC